MNASKSILLIIFILLPLFAVSQTYPLYRSVTKREVEKVGKKMYVTSSGDTTYVANALSDKLKGKDSEFLFKASDPVIDSIFEELDPKYKNLEGGIIEVTRLLQEIEEAERRKKANDALSVRLITKNKQMEERRRKAETIADSIMYSNKPVEELAADYARFGNKPTYYINGVEVPYSVTNQLRPGEVIERSMKVADTASGNPNGEVWYLVTEKALQRIKIPVGLTDSYMQDRINTATQTPSIEQKTKELATYLEEKEKNKTKTELKSLPVVRREVTADGKTIDKIVGDNDVDSKNADRESQANPDSRTRVLSRTVNNKKVK